MQRRKAAERLAAKSTREAIEMELREGYDLSPVEAQVLAQRVQELVERQLGQARQEGQITYQAIAIEEPAGKMLRECRKVAVYLTVIAPEDGAVWATAGAEALRRERVRRLVYEALLQGGALSQEDLACILGISRKSVQRIFATYREQEQRLPSRGEIQDMGRGVSHKIPVIQRYVQDLSFTQISQKLGQHGIGSMARYLRHFALVMVLKERGLTVGQMQSVIGISENLIRQYGELYKDLNVPEHQRTLQRLQRIVLQPQMAAETTSSESTEREKGGAG